jgi:hypothetical protein
MAVPKRAIKVVQARPLRIAIQYKPDGSGPEIVEGRAELRQAILLRLLGAKGDWPINRFFGLPWVTRRKYGVSGFLGSRPPVPNELVEAWIRTEMKKERRLQGTENYEIKYINATLQLDVAFDAVPVDGSPFRVSALI